jgi:hypothetical protein
MEGAARRAPRATLALTASQLATFRRKNSKLGSYIPAAVQPGSCKVEQFRA